MATFTPIIKQVPRSDSDPTPAYSLDIAEIVNGEEEFKTWGLGDPTNFGTPDELQKGVAQRLERFFKPFADTILWDHREHDDIPSAIVHIGANPLAPWEESQGRV